jgi:hypothetical protein
LLYGKFYLYNIKNISDEHKENIQSTIEVFANKFNIEEENKVRFYAVIDKFIPQEVSRIAFTP